MARSVVLVTRNPHKPAEYAHRLSQYGLTLRHRHSEPDALTDGQIDAILDEEGVIAVMRERSNLFADGEVLTEHQHLQVATNRTVLLVSGRDREGARTERRYVREIEGHIDLSRRQDRPGVFGWDDIFVSAQTGRTYFELRGLKLSARDLVISDFVRDRLWYRTPIQLRWQPVGGSRSIDFSRCPVRFIEEHPIYRRIPDAHPLRRVLSATLSEGLFFRAAKNRREKNYWIPGLNAGVPFVPKRDDVHEATFMFHDLMHFAFPDLLFDGRDDDRARRTYIAHRMTSEAFTLVLADMVFADLLRRDGLEYDFTARRIHPILVDSGLDPADPVALRRLLVANARYCLLGDLAPYTALGVRAETLARFTDKYEQFFVSDYRWTARNFDTMVSGFGPRAAGWLALIAPIRAALPFQTPTVSDAVARLESDGVDFTDPAAIVDGVVLMYLERLEQLCAQRPAVTAEGCLRLGFARYLMGQLALTVAYDFLPESRYTGVQLAAAASAPDSWTLSDVRRLRGFFEQYLDLLCDRRLISEDDRDTWREVFPLFEPHYVDYDVPVSESLSSVSHSLLCIHT
jgi:inosine/xanthosine triphosphate pyrophosphatase family protein